MGVELAAALPALVQQLRSMATAGLLLAYSIASSCWPWAERLGKAENVAALSVLTQQHEIIYKAAAAQPRGGRL
jgi:hypothetical protein